MAKHHNPLSRIKLVAAATLAAAALWFLASCGAEAPTFAPGDIQVTSDPAGAAIFLNGEATGLVTPATLNDLDAGLYALTVELADHVSDPAIVTLELKPLDNLTAAFTLSPTGLTVAGPEGAAIHLDGEDTGRIAPATFVGLEPGTITVSLQQDTYLFQPASLEVTVIEGEVTELPEDTFVRRSRRTVVVEGFANVGCVPCPILTDNLLALAAKPGFGPDRMIFLEYNVYWPDPVDPFYLYNSTENGDRHSYYGSFFVLPNLFVDGAALGDPLNAPSMEAEVEGSLNQDPGFLIDVEVGTSNGDLPVKVTLTAAETIDLGNHLLMVVLFENEIIMDDAPGVNGQTEFHNVFRDRVDSPPEVGLLVGGTPKVFDVVLTPGIAAANEYTVAAFVQRTADKYILQGGSWTTEGAER